MTPSLVQREAPRDAAKMLTVGPPPDSSANEAPSPSVSWENRWVEIAQINATFASDKADQEDASPNGPHRIEPMFTPMRLLLAFLALALTLALIETLFRSTIYERRR